MGNNLLGDFLKLKFKASEVVISLLPKPIKGSISLVQQKIIRTVYEVSGEYVSKNNGGLEDKSLKSIKVD